MLRTWPFKDVGNRFGGVYAACLIATMLILFLVVLLQDTRVTRGSSLMIHCLNIPAQKELTNLIHLSDVVFSGKVLEPAAVSANYWDYPATVHYYYAYKWDAGFMSDASNSFFSSKIVKLLNVPFMKASMYNSGIFFAAREPSGFFALMCYSMISTMIPMHHYRNSGTSSSDLGDLILKALDEIESMGRSNIIIMIKIYVLYYFL